MQSKTYLLLHLTRRLGLRSARPGWQKTKLSCSGERIVADDVAEPAEERRALVNGGTRELGPARTPAPGGACPVDTDRSRRRRPTRRLHAAPQPSVLHQRCTSGHPELPCPCPPLPSACHRSLCSPLLTTRRSCLGLGLRHER